MPLDPRPLAGLAYLRASTRGSGSLYLAPLIGVDEATFLRMEQGLDHLTLMQALMLAEHFKVPLDALL